MAFSNISALSALTINHDENDIENKWVVLEDFLEFLRKEHRPTDKIPKIKKSNVCKELKGHQNGFTEVDGQQRVSLRSILRYFFNHSEQLYICQKVVHQIEKKCFGKNTASELTVKGIYSGVVKTLYRSENIEKHILESLEVDESEIDTLFESYKKDFDTLEWKKICIFEHHFGHSSYYNESDSYETHVKQKALYLDLLKETHNIQTMLLKSSKLCIVERIQRRKKSECDEAVSILGHRRHFPEILEVQLLNLIPEYLGIDKIVCVDCTSHCQHLPSIHVYVEKDDITDEQIADICILIESCIRKNHNDKCVEIIFLSKGSLESYVDKFGRTIRFELRDDIMTKKLNENIFHVWTAGDDEFEENDLPMNCESCYGTTIAKPLNWSSFDILTEWSMNVPIIGQIILESYIYK